MRNTLMPAFTWAAAPAARADSWHSIVIAFVRAFAAIEVAAAHLRALFYPGTRTIADPALWYQGFAFITGFGHQAVLLFFVISGWLVGGSLLDKWTQPDALANYAVDRATRLWTVLIPVFVLSLLLGIFQGDVDMHAVDYASLGDFSALTLFGNLAGLQTIAVPTFGANFPLWSLANETWYYCMFPLLVVLVRTPRLARRIGCLLMLAVLLKCLPTILLLYFMIWLLGAACSRIQIDCGRGMRALLIVAALGASAYFRLTGMNDDLAVASFGPDLVISVLFLLILCSLRNVAPPTGSLSRRVAAGGRYLAEFSFTVYVLHVPLIYLLKHYSMASFGIAQLSPHSPAHLAVYTAMLAGLVAAAWLFYLMFESHTGQVRKWAKRKLLRPATAATAPA